jgi:hypothetical protein
MEIAMIRTILATMLSIALALPAMAGEFASSVDAANLSKSRHTTLGLYLTAGDAAAALEADPGIVLVDVRTRAELSYVGHADPVDQNVPLRFSRTGLTRKAARIFMMTMKTSYGILPR